MIKIKHNQWFSRWCTEAYVHWLTLDWHHKSTTSSQAGRWVIILNKLLLFLVKMEYEFKFAFESKPMRIFIGHLNPSLWKRILLPVLGSALWPILFQNKLFLDLFLLQSKKILLSLLSFFNITHANNFLLPVHSTNFQNITFHWNYVILIVIFMNRSSELDKTDRMTLA